MSFTVRIEGLTKLTAEVKELPAELNKQVGAVLENGAKTWVAKAKRAAPKDMGRLAQSISYFPLGSLRYEVVSQAEYSPYVEFGTKSKVQIPPGLEDFAAKFKGTGDGDYYDFLNAILDWVKRKGIASITNSYTGRKSTKKEDLLLVAQTIAFFIMKNGIKPHPYFFPQMQPTKQQVETQIQTVVNNLKV